MESVREDIRELSKQLRDEREVAFGEELAEVIEAKRDVADQVSALTRPQSFRRHIVDYIAEQKRLLEAGERTVEEGTKRKPLCGCGRPYCTLKQGNVPPAALMADSLEDGITEFVASHSGEPMVLLEAREDYLELYTETRLELEQILATLRGRDAAEDGADEDGEAEAGA